MLKKNRLLTIVNLLSFLFVILGCNGVGGSGSESSGTDLDTTPPILSNGSPTGTLSAGTTQTILSLTTDENATCRYTVVSGVDYSSMPNTFQDTGNTSHLTTVTGLEDGQSYTYYIRCQDSAANANPNDYPISFSVNYMTPTVTISKMYAMSAGNKLHATTRGTIDLVHRCQGTWFVFHGESKDPCCAYNGFQTSSDGLTWSSLKTGANAASDELSRSYLVEGSTIGRLYLMDDNNIYTLYTSEGTISGNSIIWGSPRPIMQGSYYYYNDLKRDSSGRLHFSGRHYDGTHTSIFWMRARTPYDDSVWESPFIVLQGDANRGVDGHENLQLDGNEVYVISRTNSHVYSPGNPGKFYGRHFDGTNWEAVPTELGVSDGIAGSDKRLCAVFDPNVNKIHLVYIDNNSNLYHRTLSKPYDSSNWSAPVLVGSNVFTCTIGIDTSVSPSHIALVYGTELATDGGRFHTGDLYLKWFDGQNWESNGLLISESGTTYNWYPNMIRDVSGEIGVMYLKGHWSANSPDIMFSLIQY